MSWKTLSTKSIESNKHLRFMVDEFETESGKKGEYYYHSNAYGDEYVSVFIQTAKDTFIMIEEYRYLFDRMFIANPRGGIEKDETIEDAAMRETIEESGYQAVDLIPLGQIASAPAISKERMCLFLATSAKKVGQRLDEMENIRVREMSASEIDQAIASGEIWDGCTISGWTKVKLYLGL